MKQLKIKLHSVVDLITNSSTVIFTDNNKHVDTLKDVMNELFKIYNINEKVEDIFDIDIQVSKIDEKVYHYIYDNPEKFNISYNDDFFQDRVDELTTKYCTEIKSRKVKLLDWIDELVKEGDSTWIVINSKDKKYEYLAELFRTLFYSVDIE